MVVVIFLLVSGITLILVGTSKFPLQGLSGVAGLLIALLGVACIGLGGHVLMKISDEQ